MFDQVKAEFIRYLFDLLKREGQDVTLYDDPINPQVVFPLGGSLWRLRASAIEPYYEHDQG